VNLFKTRLRRTTSVVAGLLLGMAGVAALAAPASAHSPDIQANKPCLEADGHWTVLWKIGNDYPADATVGEISATAKTEGSDATTPVQVHGPAVEPDAVAKANTAGNWKDSLAATTGITDAKVTSVTLKVILVWPDGYTNDGQGDHRTPETLTVDTPTAKCTPAGGTPSSSSASATPTPTNTKPGLPIPTPPTGEPNVFTPLLEEDCSTITIGADNPADGITWKFVFKTSKGEERSFTLKPGEKKSEKFSATEGFSVKVTISVTVQGQTFSDFTTIDYQKPDNCTGGEGGGLPVTGAAAGGIAGTAAAVLALGAVLFVLARRRKVKFTA
jgi:hypothetical protein